MQKSLFLFIDILAYFPPVKNNILYRHIGHVPRKYDEILVICCFMYDLLSISRLALDWISYHVPGIGERSTTRLRGYRGQVAAMEEALRDRNS